jgi:aspartate-semialdehyde dehydrogenase
MSSAGLNIAVVGATGMVGSTILSILEERKFPVNKLFLLASQRSVGDIRDFKGKSHFIENIEHFDFSQTALCFFCAGGSVSAEYAPKAAALGNIIIDKSSYFRYDPEVPLVVPEVNPKALVNFKIKNIIASPNCNTIPLVMAIKPIYDAVGITRINIATYQAVSGTGKAAVEELVEQTKQCLSGQPIKHSVYPQQIAFNVLPHIDAFEENGYTLEEMKIVRETRKIFEDNVITINPTAVRVPVFYGHSAAVHIETKQKITARRAIELLKTAPGITLNIGKLPYSTPVQDAAGEDAVYVGRIREDISFDKGLDLWVVADNVRKGAALNAIQIAEKLIDMGAFVK